MLLSLRNKLQGLFSKWIPHHSVHDCKFGIQHKLCSTVPLPFLLLHVNGLWLWLQNKQQYMASLSLLWAVIDTQNAKVPVHRAISSLLHGLNMYCSGYTVHQPGIWSGPAGWRAAWRWRGETHWASAAGKPPASRSHGRDTQTLYSAAEGGECKGKGQHRVRLTSSGCRMQLQTPTRMVPVTSLNGAE